MKKLSAIVLLLFFICSFFLFELDKTSFNRPQGLHQWRQSIGAAYAKNYYNYDLNPTESRIYNYMVNEANSDKAFAEFPLLYYSIAVLYKIFGPHEFIFRLVNLIVLFLGLFYLMKLLNIFLRNNIWSLLLTILAFTSPVLVYYSNSFIPDTTAYALIYIALYHIARYNESNRFKNIVHAVLIFTLAGLLKVTSLVPFIAISGSFITWIVVDKNFRAKYPIWKIIPLMLIPVLASFSWYLFVSIYHGKYGGNVSAVEIRPIWRLNDEVIQLTWRRIWKEWIWTYYHPSVLIGALLCFLISIGFLWKKLKFNYSFFFLAILGSTAFFFLFFRSLRDHDYYLIVTFYLVIFAFAYGIKAILQKQPPKWLRLVLPVLFSMWLVFLIYHSKNEIDRKLHVYNIWHTKWFHGLEDIEPKLREVGIQANDKVISIPDPSINISLNMMNQPGFTDFIRMNIPVEERIDFQISKGAKYLVLGDSLLYQKDKREYVKKYMKKRVLTHKNIVVYDLRDF